MPPDLASRLLNPRAMCPPDDSNSDSLETDPPVPPAVVELVRGSIDRLETLQVLFLLQGTAPRKWTIGDVSRERRSSRYAAEMSLRTLAHHRLLSREEDVYRFAPHTDELAEQAVALAECYRIRPAAVIALIFSR